MKRTSEERKAFVETRAAEMAENPTGAEARMWEILEPLGFKRQVVIEGETKNGGRWSYILDFYWEDQLAAGLCIEVDGSSHRTKAGRDRRRDMRLRGENIRTIRFSNNQVLKKPDYCWVVVKATMDGEI